MDRKTELLAASIAAAPIDSQRENARRINAARDIARQAWRASTAAQRHFLAPDHDDDRAAEYAIGPAWLILERGGTPEAALAAARAEIDRDARPAADVDPAALTLAANERLEAASSARRLTGADARIDPLPEPVREVLNTEPKAVTATIEQALRPAVPSEEWAALYKTTPGTIRKRAHDGRKVLRQDRPRVLALAARVAEEEAPAPSLSRALGEVLGSMRTDARKGGSSVRHEPRASQPEGYAQRFPVTVTAPCRP